MECLFYLPKLIVLSEIGKNLMRALGRILFIFLVMRGLNLMRALIQQRKKHSGLS